MLATAVVTLCRADALVAGELLHAADIGTGVQELAHTNDRRRSWGVKRRTPGRSATVRSRIITACGVMGRSAARPPLPTGSNSAPAWWPRTCSQASIASLPPFVA